MPTYKKTFSAPVMAVLANNQTISDLQRQTANTRARLLATANREVNNVLYFFSLRDVNLKKRTITGYYWHRARKLWLQQEFPFPDILYVRSRVDPKYEETFTELSGAITRSRGKLMTHRRFNKWRLYQIMNKDPVMKSHLPVTRSVKQPDDIEKMLWRYKVVYLKSHLGRKGENVLRVEVLPDGAFRYSCYRYGLLTARTTSSFRVLLDAVNRFFEGRRFIIQQGIQLPTFDNKLIDMRAEVQRNGYGDLDIVGISVRYGQPGSPITTHGNAFRFDDFFLKYMGYSDSKLEAFRSACQQFLCSVYEYIDTNYGHYPEIGIDFAVDSNNKIWFIEANAQSTKASLRKAYGKEALYRYYKNILEYARYLCDRPQRRMTH